MDKGEKTEEKSLKNKVSWTGWDLLFILIGGFICAIVFGVVGLMIALVATEGGVIHSEGISFVLSQYSNGKLSGTVEGFVSFLSLLISDISLVGVGILFVRVRHKSRFSELGLVLPKNKKWLLAFPLFAGLGIVVVNLASILQNLGADLLEFI